MVMMKYVAIRLTRLPDLPESARKYANFFFVALTGHESSSQCFSSQHFSEAITHGGRARTHALDGAAAVVGMLVWVGGLSRLQSKMKFIISLLIRRQAFQKNQKEAYWCVVCSFFPAPHSAVAANTDSTLTRLWRQISLMFLAEGHTEM